MDKHEEPEKQLIYGAYELKDGTLIVTVPKVDKIHRVIVQEDSTWCKMFYEGEA